jgi:hypothetical protein
MELKDKLMYKEIKYGYMTDYGDKWSEKVLYTASTKKPGEYFYVNSQRFWLNPITNILMPVADPVPLEIIPHPNAPLFNGTDGLTKLAQLATEITSSNFSASNESVLDLLRQATLVNLWWALKFIAGYSGPYNLITDHLHADMANFAQKMLIPGTKNASFIFRSGYKSTIFTHGFNWWLVLRNPHIQIGVITAVGERGDEFMHHTQNAFDSNKLVELLFPSFVPRRNAVTGKILEKNWTLNNFVTPARTRYCAGPTVKSISVNSSTAGNHFDHISADDLVGDDQLTVDRAAGADMLRAGNWFKSNERSLMVTPGVSTIGLSATRYAVDDPYERIMRNTKYVHSKEWIDGIEYEPDESKEWNVYYRLVEENGRMTFPEKHTRLEMLKLSDTDFWTYALQYMNNPRAGALNELSDYELRECYVDWREDECIIVPRGQKALYLKDMDVLITVDPGASEKRKTARTSKSAVVVTARDVNDRDYIIDVRNGYYSPTQLMDKMFSLHKLYKSFIRATFVEMQGAFKLLKDMIRKEEKRRKYWLNLREETKSSNKHVNIRNNLQPKLERGEVYTTKQYMPIIQTELNQFPSGTLDLLDAISLGIEKLHVPDGVDEDDEDENDKEEQLKQSYLKNYLQSGSVNICHGG